MCLLVELGLMVSRLACSLHEIVQSSVVDLKKAEWAEVSRYRSCHGKEASPDNMFCIQLVEWAGLDVACAAFDRLLLTFQKEL